MSGGAAPSASPVSGFLSSMDPVGNQLTQWGGDPFNIYGNASTTAALFPSSGPNAKGYTNGSDISLPAPAGGVQPTLYSPYSFTARQPAPGIFNAMAAQLAGPVYQPTILARPAAAANPAALRAFAPVPGTGPGGLYNRNIGMR